MQIVVQIGIYEGKVMVINARMQTKASLANMVSVCECGASMLGPKLA